MLRCARDTLFAKTMDPRVISAFTRVFRALCPRVTGGILGAPEASRLLLTVRGSKIVPSQNMPGRGTTMRRSGAVSIACNLGIGLLALTFGADHRPAHAQSADLVLCDRVAADPSDPDKPADVRGTA